MEPTKKPNKKIGIVIGIVVVAAVACVSIFSNKKSAVAPVTDSADASTSGSPVPAAQDSAVQLPPADAAKQSASVYKDGTYSATGSYMSPGGLDHIGVTLALANDIITDVSATPEAGDNTSARYQAKFISGYKQYVVGKNIADVHLTKVSGSSLTPKGFDDALAQIEKQAAA